MTKQIRKQVYEKFNGHCAYCGREIKYTNMQVDHLVPRNKLFMKHQQAELNHINNLMPSCRRCNHYKRALSLEQFRYRISVVHERILNTYIAKVAIDYGILEFKPFNGIFYYESYNINNRSR